MGTPTEPQQSPCPACCTAGGFLTLAGRIKELINRGGEKVAPAEVEAPAEAVPGVALAVAFPLPDSVYGERVALALVCHGREQLATGGRGGVPFGVPWVATAVD